jgi:radial spoke head protein 9
MDLQNVSKVSALSGYSLNIEETSGLEVAILQRKREENLSGRLVFWGKVFGVTQDYLVVLLIDPCDEFPSKKYYYCTTSDYTLRAVPALSAEYEAQAEGIITQFTGDPSFMAYNGAEPEEPTDPDDPDAPPPKEVFREVHRLTYIIQQIDHDCSVIPRGALVVDATKKVIFNNYYSGLSYHTSAELRAYYHFRFPENPQGIASLKKPGIIKADFLDCITKDVPTGKR